MSIPVATALERRERFWPAVTASVAVHVAVVAWAMVRVPPPVDLDQQPMRARLVRLGEKKPEHLLPRKEEPAPAPAPAPQAAPPVPEAKPAPAAPPAPVPGAKPAPSSAKQPAPRGASTSSGGGLAAVLNRVRKEVAQEQRYGDPDGDAAGDSDTAEGDRYHALVERALRSSYDVPSTISEQERLYLKAVVLLYIEPDGAIGRWRFEERSGNPAFDAALERTLRSARMPPPPQDRRDFYRRTGLQVMFKI